METVKVLVKGQMPFSESLSKQDRMSLAGGSHPQFMHPPAGIANDDIESQLTAVRPDILFLNSRQGSRTGISKRWDASAGRTPGCPCSCP